MLGALLTACSDAGDGVASQAETADEQEALGKAAEMLDERRPASDGAPDSENAPLSDSSGNN